MNSDRKKLLVNLLFLSFLLLVLNVTALKFHLYWTTWWMDVINHFLGGVIVAFAFVVFCTFISKDSNFFTPKYFILGVIAMLAVGILWEVFELAFALTFIEEARYWGDTIVDIIMDIVGTLTAYLYLAKKN